jgi:hypothetical protein
MDGVWTENQFEKNTWTPEKESKDWFTCADLDMISKLEEEIWI